ncbi:metal dependent phosphohydrolase [Denitrovibrio acetiphilus DSM 12809]|uniref:Metal dependent phosphohydrolase n=1 Tax=Denitrovibrio acetiphilus (strain DSM 12809 / NBRC 114555 / N2460) TaxID=522772 RepID=D4H6S7_DENA2|nr:HD domain-containing phosphohydrolase [Denitrovibrio acetiphilus]ADD67793.1 metal dependent phosphohydrolase [Denitrovibrio acetiphilus DSM 12809]
MDINCENHFYDKYVTSTFDIAYALSKALDLVNPLINNHHQRVAFIAGSIAREAGYTDKEVENVILASLVHDIGVVVEKEFHELVGEEETYERELSHVLVGSYLLKDLNIFPDISQLVKYHHTPYKIEKNLLSETEAVPELAYIIHLADRIDIMLLRDKPALEQRNHVIKKISTAPKNKFHPMHSEAFLRLAEREHFWFDIEEQDKYPLIKYSFRFSHINMTLNEILETAKLLSRIIDFRCVFTATHSAGVAAVAQHLAELSGMTEIECKAAQIAGYLHDIGKLAIPSEILYKNDKLNDEEIQILRKHPYFTYTILNHFQIFDTIKDWAAFHHEFLNGTGYPFHLSGHKLCKGSRIMTVADIFTAMTEERPYRTCEPKENFINIIRDMVKKDLIDSEIVELLINNYDAVFCTREKAQKIANEEFNLFRKNILSNEACHKNKNFINVLNT